MKYTQLLLLFILHLFPIALQSDVKKIEALDVAEKKYDDSGHDFLSCDLTENICDINCCFDKDCNYLERSSFSCDEIEKDVHDGFADLSEKECEVGEGNPILCLHHSNSPYLGRFYQELEGDSTIKAKQNPWFPPNQIDYSNPQFHLTSTNKLKHLIPTNIFGKSGFCLPRPIRIPINSHFNCLYTITEETCLTNRLFNISNFVSSELLQISEGSDITLIPEVICLNNGSNYVTLSHNIFEVDTLQQQSEEMQCDLNHVTTLNKSTTTCENVVVGLIYTLNFNGSLVTSGNISILLADIPINLDSFASYMNQTYNEEENDHLYLYVSQGVHVYFSDTNKPKLEMNNGYRIQQSLVFI